MDREYSAIDAIFIILDRLDGLDKKIQMIDDNIKILNNKVAKLNRNTSQEPQKVSSTDSQRHMPTAVALNQPTTNMEAEASVSLAEPEKLLLGPVKVYGYIMNKMKQPVSDVVINIFDSTNKLVKTNKSSQEGYWEVRLPTGKYNIEYIHSKFKPINKEVEIPKNVKEYEIK